MLVRSCQACLRTDTRRRIAGAIPGQWERHGWTLQITRTRSGCPSTRSVGVGVGNECSTPERSGVEFHYESVEVAVAGEGYILKNSSGTVPVVVESPGFIGEFDES